MADRLYATTHTDAFKAHLDEDREEYQINRNIVEVMPTKAPLLTLLAHIGTVTLDMGRDSAHYWQYIGMNPRVVTINGALSNSATTFVVDSTAGIVAGQILKYEPSGEQIFVSSVDSSTQFTSGTRGSYGGTAASIPDNASLIILAPALSEGQDSLSAIGVYPDMDSNYFQQIESDFAFTDKVNRILHYGEKPETIEERKALQRYKEQMQRTMLWQKKKKIAASGSTGARYLMGGIEEYIEAGDNVFSANGAFTWPELDEKMTATIREGDSMNKIALCSRNVARIMNNWSLSSHQADMVESKMFGTRIKRFFGNGWNLDVLVDDQFETAGYSDQLYILDPNYIKHVIAKGMGDTVNRDITGPKKDGKHTIKHQITGIHSIAVNIPNAHAIIRDITS